MSSACCLVPDFNNDIPVLDFMHLCVVSPFPPEITGVGLYGWNVVQGLARTSRFRAITVLAQGNPKSNGYITRLRHDRPDTRKVPAPGGAVSTRRVWMRDDVWAAARLARAIRTVRPEAVWFNLGFTVFGASRPVNFLGLMAPVLTRRTGVPLVVTLHQVVEATHLDAIGVKNGPLTAWGARTATRMLLQADVVCVTLRRYVTALNRTYGARNVCHIPLGAYGPLEFLVHLPAMPPEDILFFGSAAPFKGLPVLLEAFQPLKRLRPRATLTVAGSDHPRFPGYLARLRVGANTRAGKLARSPAIHWLGARPEAQLRDLFARARVVVLPYTATTGASSVLYQAAAFGRPVVASDLADLRAAAEEEGLLAEYVRPGDPEALAESLARLLADPARQAEMARHNLAVMRTMTLDHTCARYVEVLESLMK